MKKKLYPQTKHPDAMQAIVEYSIVKRKMLRMRELKQNKLVIVFKKLCSCDACVV